MIVTILKPILLVEDNPNDLELTLLTLERSQLANDVVVTCDGTEALDYLHARNPYAQCVPGNPTVVLLDLKLPEVDGPEVLTEIRATPVLKSLPAVMLTSSREETNLPRSYKLGINAYAVKPVEFRAFIDAIIDLGVFWVVLNGPPPGSARVRRILLPANWRPIRSIHPHAQSSTAAGRRQSARRGTYARTAGSRQPAG